MGFLSQESTEEPHSAKCTPFHASQSEERFKLATGTALDYLLMVKSGDKTIVEISVAVSLNQKCKFEGLMEF